MSRIHFLQGEQGWGKVKITDENERDVHDRILKLSELMRELSGDTLQEALYLMKRHYISGARDMKDCSDADKVKMWRKILETIIYNTSFPETILINLMNFFVHKLRLGKWMAGKKKIYPILHSLPPVLMLNYTLPNEKVSRFNAFMYRIHLYFEGTQERKENFLIYTGQDPDGKYVDTVYMTLSKIYAWEGTFERCLGKCALLFSTLGELENVKALFNGSPDAVMEFYRHLVPPSET